MARSTYSSCPHSKKCCRLISTTLRMNFFRYNSSEKILGNAENWTQGCWVRSTYATSVLCRPSQKIKSLKYFQKRRLRWKVSAMATATELRRGCRRCRRRASSSQSRRPTDRGPGFDARPRSLKTWTRPQNFKKFEGSAVAVWSKVLLVREEIN